ncbi:mannosyltransferase [Stereum hirsutum FP-91666 SS1]|uniref:mannosyltransferase n=1 Tax=Stereum hirsutum (strain FP-91666) TaxID=721885 RepID=UPI00044499B7|nr:mannosyltransferase [Stereum hirsutum FP-91666 SS1]EIM82964.1 mannosyltransferase [Stereum hirsutum FP-91666 SS1]
MGKQHANKGRMAPDTSSPTPTLVDDHFRLLNFDDSTPYLTSSLLRWDAFHFTHIAREGYVYEHEWAFSPGLPLVMNIMGRLSHFLISLGGGPDLGWENILLRGVGAAVACSSTSTLYRLSFHHLNSTSLALIASLLSLIPSSPVTIHYAAYTEPFFTYFSYKGMLACAKKQWLWATFWFALAGAFRSNGVLLGGFLIWGLVVEPLLHGQLSIKKVAYAVFTTALTFVPFVAHQVAAYVLFCTPNDDKGQIVSTPLWCNKTIPLIYTHVQARYWNIGFLNYWTLSQLPNFLLAAPVLTLLFTFTLTHLSHTLPTLLSILKHRLLPSYLNTQKPASPNQTNPDPRTQPKLERPPSSPFLSSSLTPHAIHALILSLTLLFNSHTQIALRLAASMPLTYWAAAWLVFEKPWWGKIWVGWSVVWGAVSVVLWTVFLPPA